MTTHRTFEKPLISLMARDLRLNNLRLLRTRWVAGFLVLLLTFFSSHLLGLPLEETALYGLGATILLYNLILVWFTRRIDALAHKEYLIRIQRIVIAQVVLDWASMAVFVHLTGGITSPGIIFFFIHVLMVTILLPGQSPYIYALLAVFLVGGLALLEGCNILPHYDAIPQFDDRAWSNPYFILSQVIFFGIALFATVFLANGIIIRLREREQQIAILLKNMRDVTSSLELDQVLAQLTQGVAEALSVSKASIRLLEPDGEQLKMTSSYGLSQAYLEKGRVELSQSKLDRQALSGKVVIIDNPAKDTRVQYPQEIAAEGIQSMLVVPIIGRQPLGVLRVYAPIPRYFKPRDAEIVQAIARQSANVIENALVYDALQRTEQQRTLFIMQVTHELRAPVTGAKSLLRVLLNNILGDIPPKQVDILQRLEVRMDSLLSLIRDLLALAETKSQVDLPTNGSVELQPIVNETIEKFRVQADEKEQTLKFDDGTTGLVKVIGTDTGLHHVLDNILGNAIKYTPENGTISIEIIDHAPSVLVVIKDSGIGIPPDDINRLGEEFFRASNARKSGIEGTGLGLTIVKHLVSQFGGLLSIQSEPERGTTVTLTLRISSDDSGLD